MAENVLNINLDDEVAVKIAIAVLQDRATGLRRARRKAGLSVVQRLDLTFNKDEFSALLLEGGFSAHFARMFWNDLTGRVYRLKDHPRSRGYKLGLDGGLRLGMLLSERVPAFGGERIRDWVVAEFGLEGVDATAWEEKFMRERGLEYS